MNDAQAELLDLAADDTVAGFRLARFEVYNWGTFDEKVWYIAPAGHNALLTGDIGSGKSTLVDGLTTLLYPSHRITYNKAAGAERQERSPYSYVRGAYGATQDEATRVSRGLYLRDERNYSVLLAQFRNEGFDKAVTLAQVWWLKSGESTPSHFYVIAETPLSITADFGDFGGDLQVLRRRLRNRPHVVLEDSFERYAARFRRLMGLSSSQALELFYQTVSMKSVGDLTAFVRAHMLEATDIGDTLNRLLQDFDNLNAAHASVLKAEAQISALKPIIETGARHEAQGQELALQRGDRDALSAWFARLAENLLHTRLEELALELAKRSERRVTLSEKLETVDTRRMELRIALRDAGGDRLEAIGHEIKQAAEVREQRQLAAKAYREQAELLSLPAAGSDHAFHRNRRDAERLLTEAEEAKEGLDKESIDAAVELRAARTAHGEIQQDIKALKTRRSNIDRKQLDIRSQLCEALSVSEAELPFAGELVEVREDESAWEGAIERVLHNFALSLLVPEALYARVAHFVDCTRLGARLVYHRMQTESRRRTPELHAQSLVRKLSIKPDSGHYAWLERELARNFNLACCEGLEMFRREQDALTLAGQIKRGGQRHEKDDRYRLDDRSRFVLGWRIEAKLRGLLARLNELAREAQQAADAVANAGERIRQLETRRDAAKGLVQIARYEDIHWQAQARAIEQLERDREDLRASSDQLRLIEEQLEALNDEARAFADELGRANQELGNFESDQRQAREQLDQALATISALNEASREHHFPRLDAGVPKLWGERTPRLSEIVLTERHVREALQTQIKSLQSQVDRSGETLTRTMADFRNAYAAETADFDASPEALPEYGRMLARLEHDDLPRHRERFRNLLRENTIQGVAMLRSRLQEQEQAIQDRIGKINRSLEDVDYTAGTYICLKPDHNPDTEIRDFRHELRGILEGTLAGDEAYSEQRFLRVKQLIERFRGRAEQIEADRSWTAKVTDVRHWFCFAASERWREDHTEKEYYPDSGGKSGGQKEKLAYTVLAASLAYQFGLEWNETRSRSFRFVVIDEAFGRGSDESTRYGLELFRRLNLQLLIVTPLQKVNIIEEYIRAVHFVHQDGERSVVRNLSLEEYLEEKARRLARS